MNKIGIITHYFNNRNYGGNLQAYALCRYLQSQGYDAEQISYCMGSVGKMGPYCFKDRMKKLFNPKILFHSVTVRAANKILRKQFVRRTVAIDQFNGMIPHGENAYTVETISNCDEYDLYITGSDQVWNLEWYEPAFFLDFVSEGKKKLSYAASVGKKELAPEQQEIFRKKLANFTAVSVREADAIDLLDGLSPVPVVQTLDPTLLLSREQWDEVCSQRMIPEKYIFTFFLGEDANQRKVASEFAKKKGLPIVTLPFLGGSFQRCDLLFGDKKLYAVSPADFISLIKHAEYVLTDSFHACVFSSIYQKEFFAFQRLGHAGMGGRLYSLTKLFRCEERFCDTWEKATLSYIEGLPAIDYSRPLPEFTELLEFSKKFLLKNLE